MSGGGFDSLTDKHKFAAALAKHERPTEVLHTGDHDPSGVSMFLSFLEDVEAFTRDLGGQATFTRLIVTPEQIRQYDLPTAPPKDTDRRALSGATCQAEALSPDLLAQIVRSAIESRIDISVLNRVKKREEQIQLDAGAAQRLADLLKAVAAFAAGGAKALANQNTEAAQLLLTKVRQ
jgi:hypothetical protein